MGVLFLLLFIPWIKGCFHPKPKVIFIDLAAMPPPPPAAEPEPVEDIKPPKPAPKPKPLPDPPKTNAPPKVVKSEPKKAAPKPEPKKTEPKKEAPKKAEPKPKTMEERLAEIRQNKKVTNPNIKPVASKPSLDLSGLKSALNSAASGTSSGSGSGSSSGVYSPFAWYYDRVKQQMYSVWQQPAGAPIGLTATATVQIGGDGTVYSKSITRRSGNMPFDQSVQSALNATTRLPVPPSDLPSRTIEIEFALSD